MHPGGTDGQEQDLGRAHRNGTSPGGGPQMQREARSKHKKEKDSNIL